MAENRTVSFTIPENKKVKLEQYAENDRRTLSQYIRMIIEDFLAQRKVG